MTIGVVRAGGRLLPLAGVVLALTPASAGAVIGAPTTVDGPGRDVVEVGGTALSPDGASGGVVYTKTVDGVAHVFVSRYRDGRWGAPLRADGDRRFEGRAPRIAAGANGSLLVVWVTPVATIGGSIQYGLVSASLAAGSNGFGPSLIVDAKLGNGLAATPSLSRTATGQAIVAYRVVTNDFQFGSAGTTQVQLKPGDVMADVRVARLSGNRWSRLGAINRNPAASLRTPTDANGPLAVASPDGTAVVAWQEPDQTGTARVWARRVFGTTIGPPLQATPSDWEGRPLNADADAFALDATRFGMAQVVARLAGGPGTPLNGQQLVGNTLPPTLDDEALRFDGARAIGALAPALGVPDVAVADNGDRGDTRVAYSIGGVPQLASDGDGGARAGALAGPPLATATTPVRTALTPSGGGLVAWATADADGRQGIALQQEFPGGARQSATIAGVSGGPVAQLTLGRAVSGDALVAFRQGDAARAQVVVAPVTVPPARFLLRTPSGWVRARRARVAWEPATSATGGVTYSLVLDGRVVKRGLRARSYLLPARLLGSGIRHVQVLATDRGGQEQLTDRANLRVDQRPPIATAAARRGRRVVVTVADAQSRLALGRVSISFGDRSRRVSGRRAARHVYRRAGTYTVLVRARDRAGNSTVLELPVAIR